MPSIIIMKYHTFLGKYINALYNYNEITRNPKMCETLLQKPSTLNLRLVAKMKPDVVQCLRVPKP